MARETGPQNRARDPLEAAVVEAQAAQNAEARSVGQTRCELRHHSAPELSRAPANPPTYDSRTHPTYLTIELSCRARIGRGRIATDHRPTLAQRSRNARRFSSRFSREELHHGRPDLEGQGGR